MAVRRRRADGRAAADTFDELDVPYVVRTKITPVE